MLQQLLRSTRVPVAMPAGPLDFRRDEEGAATIFGLVFFAAMVIAGGFAIDLMRSENDRTYMQYTADRAVLAAAALGQEREAKAVVEDYMRAAGIAPDSVRIQVQDDDTSTRITVRGDARTKSLFMNVVGLDELTVPIWSQARQDRWDLEVSMVLDISSSMNSSGKHDAMQDAAVEFVEKALEDADEGDYLTTVSVVPYWGTVNLGSEMSGWFSLTDEHDHSNCVVFEDAAAYQTAGIVAGTVLSRVPHIDVFDTSTNADGLVDRPLCPADDTAAILPWSDDVDALTAYIEALVPIRGTAIPAGVKWGAALLDPSLQPQAQAFIDAGNLSSDYDGMPFDYGSERVRKVLIVMTDGRNSWMLDAHPDRRDGPSGVFVYRPDLEVPVRAVVPVADHNDDGEIDDDDMPCTNGLGSVDGVICSTDASGFDAPPAYGRDNVDGSSGWSPSWWAKRARGQDWAANGGAYEGYAWWSDADRIGWSDFEGMGTDPDTGAAVETQFSIWSERNQMFWVKNLRGDRNLASGGKWMSEPAGGTDAIELTFAEFYATIPVEFEEFFEGWNGDPAIDDATRSYYFDWNGSNGQLNGYLSDVCRAARTEGVLVYAIAFQAPQEGRDAMLDCAGEASRYHNVTDLDIASAFDEILASINLLRLTQ